jgi:hypothetical protein
MNLELDAFKADLEKRAGLKHAFETKDEQITSKQHQEKARV